MKSDCSSEAWIQFFLEGVRSESQDAVRRAERLYALREAYRARLKAAKASPLQYRVVDLLFERTLVSAGTVVLHLDVTHRAAMISLRALKELGLVIEPLKRKRHRVFWAKQINDLLETESP